MSEGHEPSPTGEGAGEVPEPSGPAPGTAPADVGPDLGPAGAEPVDLTAVAPGPDDVTPGELGLTGLEATAGPAPEPSAASGPVSVESLLDDVERLTRERDEFLDGLRRTQADFENYRKRMMKQQADQAELAASRLVEDLLPVLDACDGAIHHGATEVEPVFGALLGTLEKSGLERIDPGGEAFDPNLHDAVMHEPAEEGDGHADGTVVTDVLRRGYSWKGRVLRPAMVKVRG